MTLADLGWAFLRIVILLGFLLGALPVVIWLERRVLAWFQNQIGPNRLGPFGLLQPMADAWLFFKEEIIPAQADRLIWSLAPALSLFPALVAAAHHPAGTEPPADSCCRCGYRHSLLSGDVVVGGVWGAAGGLGSGQQIFAAGRAARQRAGHQLRAGHGLIAGDGDSLHGQTCA